MRHKRARGEGETRGPGMRAEQEGQGLRARQDRVPERETSAGSAGSAPSAGSRVERQARIEGHLRKGAC